MYIFKIKEVWPIYRKRIYLGCILTKLQLSWSKEVNIYLICFVHELTVEKICVLKPDFIASWFFSRFFIPYDNFIFFWSFWFICYYFNYLYDIMFDFYLNLNIQSFLFLYDLMSDTRLNHDICSFLALTLYSFVIKYITIIFGSLF